MTWTPCYGNLGLYWYCIFGMMGVSPYDWTPMKCIYVRVAQDLPPKITFFGEEAPLVDRPSWRVRMGESLSVMVRAVDNPSDSVDFLKLASIDAVTGDALRAKVEYVYDKGTGTLSSTKMRGWARLVEPMLPVYLRMAVLPQAASNSLGQASGATPYLLEREVVLKPSRQHSGLDMTICFLAVDARGECKTIGSATKRCLTVSVERCVYVMQAGESLKTVAGMFETSWLQLFALNPTFYQADLPVTNRTAIAVGHPYTVVGGETVSDVSRNMGSDMRHLMLLNADLSRQKEMWWTQQLPVGYTICLLPNSCGTNV